MPCGCVGPSLMFSFSSLSLESVALPTRMYCASQKHSFSFQIIFVYPLLLLHISSHIMSYLLNNANPYARQRVSGIDCCCVDVYNCIGVHNYKMIIRTANKVEKNEKATPPIWLITIRLYC